MTNGRGLVLAFTFKWGQKQAQLRSAMETVKMCSECVGSTINAGSGFHCSSVLRLFMFNFQQCIKNNVCLIVYLLHTYHDLPISWVFLLLMQIDRHRVFLKDEVRALRLSLYCISIAQCYKEYEQRRMSVSALYSIADRRPYPPTLIQY